MFFQGVYRVFNYLYHVSPSHFFFLSFFSFFSHADVQGFRTPAMHVPRSSINVASSTPRTQIRIYERDIQPSMYLLPPYSSVTSTKHQDALYQKVIIHTPESEVSKLKEHILISDYASIFIGGVTIFMVWQLLVMHHSG